MKYEVGDYVTYQGQLFLISFRHHYSKGIFRYKVKGNLKVLYDFLDTSPGIRKATKLDRLLLGLDTEDNAVYNKAKDKT